MTKTTVAKITKKDNFAALRECVMDHMDWFDEGEADRLIEFIDHEVEQLDKRAASAKKYAKKMTKAEDALSDAVAEVLSNIEGGMTILEIMAALPEELAATPQKLTYRLNKMVEAGTVTKEQVSVKDEGKPTRKVNAYTWVTVDTDTDAE